MLGKAKDPLDCKIYFAHILVEIGQPVHEILAVIEGGNFDIVVMGTRGKGLIEKLLIGSVARQVVELSTVPVLTVRFPVS